MKYHRIHEGAMQPDGTAIKGRLILSARERDDAIRYIVASPIKCLILVGPYGGRITYNKPKRLDDGQRKTDGAT